MMPSKSYEFSLSPKYEKKLKEQKYLIYFIVFTNFLFINLLNFLDNSLNIQGFLIMFFMLLVIFFIIGYALNDVKLIIDEKKVKVNKSYYNQRAKGLVRWHQLKAIVSIPAQEKIFIQYFLAIKPDKSTTGNVYIFIHKSKLSNLNMAFSEDIWVNPYVTLGEAIEECSGKSCLHLTADQYHEEYAILGRPLANSLKYMAYFSIMVLVVGFGLLFLDDLFSLNFGAIKEIGYVFASIVFALSTIILLLFTSNKNKKQALHHTFSTVIVSFVFTFASTVFAYASFNLAHKHLAKIQPITFTLSKKQQDRTEEKYDHWQSTYGEINCKLSDTPKNSKFVLNVYDFMGIKRFKMADICLADEKKTEQKTP